MGLGAPKKRSKLSTDPNNTTWSKSTTNFGHRILASQGWEPGQYLGATDAAHSAHYTAANASHIRVLLREDNLGIGAKVGGNGRAETFGLATLSGIFGRLNGKSEGEVQKQQDNLRDAQLRTWQGTKLGVIQFVYGGLLVGDKMDEELVEKLNGKKRKAETEDEESVEEEKRVKRKKGEENLRAEADDSSSSSDESEQKAKKRAKKEKKDKKRKATSSDDDESESAEDAKRLRKEARRKAKRDASAQDSSAEASTTTDDKARRKEEKRAHKEEKRKRKEEKRRLKSEKASAASTPASVTPASTGTATPVFGGSRHAVRQRYIQQKRMALMDPQALREILMLKV